MVYNLGNADLTINNIAIDPNSDPEFRITRAPGPFPITVGPDQNIEVACDSSLVDRVKPRAYW